MTPTEEQLREIEKHVRLIDGNYNAKSEAINRIRLGQILGHVDELLRLSASNSAKGKVGGKWARPNLVLLDKEKGAR